MIEQSVYVMQNDKGLVKIGISKDPKVRKKQLEIERKEKIELLYYTDKYINAATIERKLHRYFKDYNYAGEWFNIEPNKAILNVMKASYSIGIKQEDEITNEKYFYNGEVKLTNEIINTLLNNYTVEEIRLILFIINRLQNNKEIKLNLMRKMVIRTHYTNKELKEKISNLNNTILISNISIKNKEIKVIFADNKILNPKTYGIIDIEELKKITSKYDLMIYLKCRMYKETGKAHLGINQLKEFYGEEIETKRLIENTKRSIKRVQDIMGIDINVKTIKNKYNKISAITIEFPKYLYKSRYRNNKPILKDYYTEDEILF